MSEERPSRPDDPRNHVRHPLKHRVRCVTQHRHVPAEAINISAGGLFVRTAHEARPGDRVRLALSDDESIEAEVVWTRKGRNGPCGMGLRFVHPEYGQQAMKQLMERTSTLLALW